MPVKELEIEALVENLPKVMEFVLSELEVLDCSPKVEMQIHIAVEEIFVNIANYAYTPDVGMVTIQMDVSEVPVIRITFIDQGIKYDPLKKEDPDVSLNLEMREIGGLGIFMVKKSMDEMSYEYKDGKNILTIIKKY